VPEETGEASRGEDSATDAKAGNVMTNESQSEARIPGLDDIAMMRTRSKKGRKMPMKISYIDAVLAFNDRRGLLLMYDSLISQLAASRAETVYLRRLNIETIE